MPLYIVLLLISLLIAPGVTSQASILALHVTQSRTPQFIISGCLEIKLRIPAIAIVSNIYLKSISAFTPSISALL